jgi:hypothetical protein
MRNTPPSYFIRHREQGGGSLPRLAVNFPDGWDNYPSVCGNFLNGSGSWPDGSASLFSAPASLRGGEEI